MTDLLDLAEVCRLEELRQSAGVAKIADESEPINSGFMCFGGIGSWVNQAMGLGNAGPVTPDEIDRLIAFYESRGVEPKLEVSPYADPSLIHGLAERRFILHSFESLLVRDLRSPLPPMPDGVAVRPVDINNDAEINHCIDIKIAAFQPEDQELFRDLDRRIMCADGVVSFLAYVDDVPAAAGTCELAPPTAGLFGGATLEPYRGRRCQTALMIARMQAAVEAGCLYAAIGSKPDGTTGRNARRLGFQLACTKVIMTRPGPGLEPSP